MSDLRGISRGSKTAAVVILVVLLQVIVVAVLGLGAIARDREDGARIARDEAEGKAQAEANRTLDLAQKEILAQLAAEARVAKTSGGHKNPAPSPWRVPFVDLFRVDADGCVFAADGTRIHVPSKWIEAEEQRIDRSGLEQAIARVGKLVREPGSEAALREARRQIVTKYEFATDGAGYPIAVGEALKLARDAAESPDVSLAAIEDAVRVAYETAVINDRPAAGKLPFSMVRGDLDAIARAPGREPIAALLDQLDRARDGLASILDLALPLARDAAGRERSPRVFPLEAGPIIAIANLPWEAGDRRSECLLARLDRVALARVIESKAVAPAGAPAGTPVRVVEREAPWPKDTTAAEREVRLPLRRLDFDPALDVVVPIPPPKRLADTIGPRESFYWTILALAALGVTTAGFVLVRVLRKEVHLARLKTDFVSNLSHELKTPLTSISMFVELLKDGRMTRDERTEALDVVGNESDRLQRIVGRMIDVARREDASTGYDLKPADLNLPVRSACERFRRLERSGGLHLELGLSSDLPPVALDVSAIDDAVTNLLANAWKYRRGDAATIRVSTRKAGRRRVDLVVSDDGIGIPRRERKRIFEMFYRAESYLTRSVPGTGLGLALVRTIVRVHRGKIRVDGAPGAGTTFRLRFPASRARPPARSEPAVANEAGGRVESAPVRDAAPAAARKP